MRPLTLPRPIQAADDSGIRDLLNLQLKRDAPGAWENIVRDFPVSWKSRRKPLEAVAVAGRGVTKAMFMDRLRRRTPAELSGLRIILEDDSFIVLGESARLPWASGGMYLGCDADAPGLLLPTTLEPTLPAHLFEDVLRSRCPGLPAQTAVFHRPLHLVPVTDARAMTDEAIMNWLWAGRRQTTISGAHACATR